MKIAKIYTPCVVLLCSAAEVPTNTGIIISLLILVIVVLFWIKRKLRKMNKHYQKAFGDIVLAFKIFISFQLE